jgi:phospholipid/cholesterol/gamma-HCH transport system substrate-binding protein
MAKLSAEAKVGLLVIVSSIILLWMTMMVGKFELGKPKGYHVAAVFDTISGLDIKAAVRLAGVQIGTVETVELVNNKAKVVLRIDPNVRIPRGAEAAVKTMGLLGDKYVDLIPPQHKAEPGTGARERSDYYRDGEVIERSVPPSDADQLITKLSGIADDVKQITASLRQVLGTEKGTKSMEDILGDLRETTANIKEFSQTLRSDGSELVVSLNELVASLNGVVGENRDNLRVTLENVKEASKNAEMAMASLDNTIKKIDKGEGTIGKLVNNDSMYNSIDSAAKGITDYVSRIERMKTIVGFRSEYMFPQSKTYATLELRPRPDTSYILELTSDPFGNFKRVEQTTTPPGETVVTETFEDKFKFSIEYAKRWGNLALRLGLIESSGGIGADYYVWDDRFKLSVDSWNYNSNEPGNRNVHVKTTASYGLGKTFFVNAGWDNFLNSQRSAPFVGVGLRFDDEDLKYLMGSVPIPK